MGDRTTATLVVPRCLANWAVELVGEEPAQRVDADLREKTGLELTFLEYDEVNYGELRGLDLVTAAGIPYDYEHDAGDGYPRGAQHLRWIDNALVTTTWEGSDAVPLDPLLKLIDQPDELRQHILDHQTNTRPVSWDTQAAYAHQLAARRLITA